MNIFCNIKPQILQLHIMKISCIIIVMIKAIRLEI